MSKKEKIDRRGLVFNSIVFVERQLYREKRKYYFFKSLYVSLNIIILLSTLAMAVVSALVLSSVVHEMDAVGKNKIIPAWYPFVAAMIPAFGGFMAAIINFFIIKERVVIAEKHYHRIQGEIIRYASGDEKYEKMENKDFGLFHDVSKEIGYKDGGTNA